MDRTRKQRELVSFRAKTLRGMDMQPWSAQHRRMSDSVQGGRDELDTRPFGWCDYDGRVGLIKTGFGRVYAGYC